MMSFCESARPGATPVDDCALMDAGCCGLLAMQLAEGCWGSLHLAQSNAVLPAVLQRACFKL